MIVKNSAEMALSLLPWLVPGNDPVLPGAPCVRGAAAVLILPLNVEAQQRYSANAHTE